jgi:uncharacterized protein
MTKKRGVNNRSDMNREVYVVGVVSDTHGLVRPGLASALAGVERILHAGDVGGAAVLDALSKVAPVDAVYGNVDDAHDPALARERVVTVGGVTIHVSHGHELGSPTPRLALARYAGDVVIFGHTHRAIVERDDRGRLAFNPGAAGPRRFNLSASVARLTITPGATGAAARTDVEIIPLA